MSGRLPASRDAESHSAASRCSSRARSMTLSGSAMTYRTSLLRLLDERGYIHQLTDAAALDVHTEREVVTAYIGFDATAPSLHVGSLVQIMLLRRLQQAGHRPIVLMGG